MYKICLRYHTNTDDAGISFNDAMQTVFTKIDQFSGNASFEAWVRRIIVTACLNKIRASARFSYQPIEQAEVLEDSQNVISRLESDEVLRLVRQLPHMHATVLMLYAVEGYTHREISTALDLSEESSRRYVSDARSKLKKLMHQYYSANNEKEVRGTSV